MSGNEELPQHSHASCHVLIFTKYPTPGYAKTRLIPAVGQNRAADISRQLTEHIVSVVRTLMYSPSLSSSIVSCIHYAAATVERDIDARMNEWIGTPEGIAQDRELIIPQVKGDLGERLDHAFASSFKAGAQKALVIGTDIPEIDATLLKHAFTTLDSADIVIGPAQDGGYYLLGMKQLHSAMFKNVPWSTDSVLEVTMRIATTEGLSVATLTTLRDVDLPEDLPYFNRIFKSFDAGELK